MSNASLKEQLEAVASQLSNNKSYTPPKKKFHSILKVKNPKPKWLAYMQYGVELLRTYFPASFKRPSEVQPLKKGIKQDLVKRLSTMATIVTEDKACMVKSLAYYVNTGMYHKSVVAEVVRIDLDGQPSGVVSTEEAAYSLERYHAKLEAKQAQLNNMNATSLSSKN